MPDEKARPDQVGSGIEKIRETARWLIKGFGALGAVLVASLQLSDIGDLTGADRTAAIISFFVGMMGVLVALLAAAFVLAADQVQLQDLTGRSTLGRFVNEHRDLLAGFPTVDALVTEYRSAVRARLAAAGAPDSTTPFKVEQVPGGAGAPASDPPAEVEERPPVQYDTDRLRLLNSIVQIVLQAAIFEKVRRTWTRQVLPLIALGVVLATLGMGVFAAHVTDAAEVVPAVAETPVPAVVDLTPAAEAREGASLGSGCNLSDMEAVVLASSDKAIELLTTDDRCRTRRFEVAPNEVAVTGCRPTVRAAGEAPPPARGACRLDDLPPPFVVG